MFNTMSTKSQELIIESLNIAIQNLSTYNTIVADVMEDNCEPFQSINDGVIDCLEHISELFSEPDSNPEELNPYTRMCVAKSVNEHIQRLEKSMAYFTQFGNQIDISEMLSCYQSKIQGLYRALFELNSAHPVE